MNKEALKQTLKQMIVDECDKEFDPETIGDETQLIGGEELDLDSLDALQISMWVQKHYGVRIESGPEARRALQSVDTLADTIIENTNQS